MQMQHGIHGQVEPAQFSVQMPAGTAPGQMMQVSSPDGQVLEFPAPNLAPGTSFPVAYTPLRHGQTSNPTPSAPPIDMGEMLQLDAVLNRFEITLAQAAELHILSEYEIVVIADDSGSMMMTDPGARMSRWEELKETLKLVVEIGGCFDESGLDIYFLNRPKVTGVTNPQHPGLQSALLNPPRGSTPLTEKLQEVVEENEGSKPVLLMIMTDGVPNGGPEQFCNAIHRLVKRQSTRTTFRVQIMACTDDDDAVGWINRLDEQFTEVDATDDYYTEKKEILQRGRLKVFTRGDWCMKAMLGAVSSKFDQMDEGGYRGGRNAGTCERCTHNCSIS